MTGDDRAFAVAIVGMACRFPGAPSVDAFWQLLRDGREAITRFSLDDCAADPADLASPQLVCAEAVLDDIDAFDARLFGISPAEAIALDPQRRVLLECAWAALEDAGHTPGHEREVTAVYAGQRPLPYLARLPPPADLAERLSALYLNEADYLATYLAFRLGLTGEAITVQTACSTSLVAVHLACQSLISRQSDLALVGAVNIDLPLRRGYVPEDGMPLSRDGTCRPFDRDGSGIVPGSGAGALVLRRLDDAVRDGDPIRAVVLGSAVNNDGGRKHGFAAPSVDGQAAVIAAAHELAGAGPDTISYVEAHGTATELGDPVEIEALRRAFGDAPRRSCAIGAVKSNLGHLQVAAGMAGLIKTVLALEHGEIPPTLHFRAPNPRIAFDPSPFFVADRRLPWQPHGVRRAGVSAFGIGGTNAHVVVEQAPPAHAVPRPDAAELVALSAATPDALAAIRTNLARHLRDHPSLAWRDAVATQNARTPLAQRWVAVARDRAELLARLDAGEPFTGDRDAALTAGARQFLDGGPPPAPEPASRMRRVRLPAYPFARDRFLAPERPSADRRLVWVFSGGGSQWPGMGRALRERDPAARARFEHLAQLIGAELWSPAAALLFDDAAAAGDPAAFVVAIFAMQVVLAEALQRHRVTAQVAVGHSGGEVAAAWWAGALTLDEASRVITARARAIARGRGLGAALAVQLDATALAEIVTAAGSGVAITVENSPRAHVVAGPTAALDAVAAAVSARGGRATPLAWSLPVHHPLLAPQGRELATDLDGALAPGAARIGLWSTVTGAPLDGRDLGARYWGDHLVAPVRFAPAIRALALAGERRFLEIAPAPVLQSAIDETLGELGIAGETCAAYGEGGSVARAAAVVRAGPRSPRAPAGGTLLDRLAALASEVLGLPPEQIRSDTTFSELGLDSVRILSLASRIRQAIDPEVTARRVFAAGSLAALADQLSRGAAPAPPPRTAELLEIHPARDPVAACVLFPGAGGSGLMMAPWAALLPPAMLGLAFDPSGHGADRRPAATEIDALLTGLEDALQELRLPIVLVGYSFGCLLAYETARRALARGLPIVHVVLSHGPPPDWWRAELPSRRPSFAARWRELHAVLGLAELDIPLDRYLASVIADYRIGEALSLDAPPLPVAASLVASAQDELYPPELIGEWRRYFAPGSELHLVEGGHFELLRSEDNRQRYRALFEQLGQR